MHLPGLILRCFLAAWLLAILTCDLHAGGKIAIVIGNGEYPAMQNLVNAPGDAAALAEALKARRFTVVNSKVENLDHDGMARCLEQLGPYKQTQLDLVVFYFAGHSVEHGGELYLLPAKSRITAVEDFEDKAFPLRRCVDRLRGLNANRVLMLLDGCRNHPANGGQTPKKASYPLSDGLCIMLATSQGKLTHDFGKIDSHGPFAAALLDGLKVPGASVDMIASHLRRTVTTRTNGAQTPVVLRADGEWDQVSLTPRDFREPSAASTNVVLTRPVYLIDATGKRCGILPPIADNQASPAKLERNAFDPSWINVSLTGWMVARSSASGKIFLGDLRNGFSRVEKQSATSDRWSANSLKLRTRQSLDQDACFAALAEGSMVRNLRTEEIDGRTWQQVEWSGFVLSEGTVIEEDLVASGLSETPIVKQAGTQDR